MTSKDTKAQEVIGLLGYAEMRGYRNVSDEALTLLMEIATKEIQVDGFPEEHFTINDFARMKFGCALDDLPTERASRLAALLAGSGYSFLVVGGKANGLHTVWVSARGFAFVMRNWTEKDDPKPVPQTDH